MLLANEVASKQAERDFLAEKMREFEQRQAVQAAPVERRNDRQVLANAGADTNILSSMDNSRNLKALKERARAMNGLGVPHTKICERLGISTHKLKKLLN